MPAFGLLTLVKFYLPRAGRIGVVYDGGRPLSAAHKDAPIRDSARAGLEAVAIDAGSGDVPSAAIARIQKDPVDAVCLAAGVGESVPELTEEAVRAKVPVFGHREDQVLGGAIAAEVPKVDRVGLEAGRMAYRILTGEKPKGIPIAEIKDTEHVLNLKVAADLGIEATHRCPADREGDQRVSRLDIGFEILIVGPADHFQVLPAADAEELSGRRGGTSARHPPMLPL